MYKIIMAINNPPILTELELFIQTVVKAELQGKKESVLTSDLDEWLTIAQAAKYIKVSSPTIWKLSKKGILSKHYINGQPRYRKSEIDKSFLKVEYGTK